MADRLLLGDYVPQSELIVPEHQVPRARFAAIDAHNHLPVTDPRAAGTDWGQIIAAMDKVNLKAVVNLSGGWGKTLGANLDALDRPYPGRFYSFCSIDFSDICAPGWLSRTLDQLREDIQAGARGLKIFKRLGLLYRDPHGRLVMPDDPRLAEIWDTVGELGVPVLIHTADPTAFFKPLDRHNERWEELSAHPDWHFSGEQFPPFEALIESLYKLIEKHPQTNFITAHVGCYAENLGFVSDMLDSYPNFYTDISARIAELGRAPYSARKWFFKYADRILFGTDLRPREFMYGVHWRFLETWDEYLRYDGRPEAPSTDAQRQTAADAMKNSDGISVDFLGQWSPVPTQGRWRIYGISLPDDVLAQVYYGNAARLLGID